MKTKGFAFLVTIAVIMPSVLTSCKENLQKKLSFKHSGDNNIVLHHADQYKIEIDNPLKEKLEWEVADTTIAHIAEEGVAIGRLIGKTTFRVKTSTQLLTGDITTEPRHFDIVESLFNKKIDKQMINTYEIDHKRSFYKEMEFTDNLILIIYKAEGNIDRVVYIYDTERNEVQQAMLEFADKKSYDTVPVREFFSERYFYIGTSKDLVDINGKPSSLYQRDYIIVKDRAIGGKPVLAYQFIEE